MEHVVDFNLFQTIERGDHCHGKGGYCKSMERVIAALDYHFFTIINSMDDKYGDDPKAAFISFCNELYPKSAILNDYIHFILHHADTESIEYIRNRLHFECESAQKCGATVRHYRDRRGDANNGVEGMESVWFIDRIDTIHFMVHHLTELGLRVSAKTLENELNLNETKEDESESVDLALRRLGREIDAKRAEFSTERLDGAKNSKFTLQVTEQNGSADMFELEKVSKFSSSSHFANALLFPFKGNGNGKETKRDLLLHEIWKRVQHQIIRRNLLKFLEQHDVDTDCIENDVEMFIDEYFWFGGINGVSVHVPFVYS